VWAVLVVIDQPSVGNCLNLLTVGEQMCIKRFSAISAIEPLDKGVLIRLSRLASSITFSVLNRRPQ